MVHPKSVTSRAQSSHLKFIFILKVACSEIFLADDFNDRMFQLLLECQIFTTRVQIINEFLSPAKENKNEIEQITLQYNFQFVDKIINNNAMRKGRVEDWR